jgi:hypothetical protein
MKDWIHNKIRSNEAATISLALLEQRLPDEVPSLRYVQHWVNGVCKELGCTATIYPGGDVVTFYPGGEQ